MANDLLLLADGSSRLLLADGTSRLLLASESGAADLNPIRVTVREQTSITVTEHRVSLPASDEYGDVYDPAYGMPTLLRVREQTSITVRE